MDIIEIQDAFDLAKNWHERDNKISFDQKIPMIRMDIKKTKLVIITSDGNYYVHPNYNVNSYIFISNLIKDTMRVEDFPIACAAE